MTIYFRSLVVASDPLIYTINEYFMENGVNNSLIAEQIRQKIEVGKKFSPRDVDSIRDDGIFYHEIIASPAKLMVEKVKSLIDKAQQDGLVIVNKPDDISGDRPFHTDTLKLSARLETFFASSDNDSTRTQELAKMTNLSLLVDFLGKRDLLEVKDYKSVRLLKLLDLVSWKRQHSTSLLSLIKPSDFNKLLKTFESLDKKTYTKDEVNDMSIFERTTLLLVGLGESKLIQAEMLLKEHKSHETNAKRFDDMTFLSETSQMTADNVASASEFLRVWKLRAAGDTKTLWQQDNLITPPRRRFLAELLDPSKNTRLNEKEILFLGTFHSELLIKASEYSPMEFDDALNCLDEVYFRIPTSKN